MPRKNKRHDNQQHTDQLPPHSIESEQGVLGCVLVDAALIRQCVDKLPDASAFYDERHRVIYRAMLDMMRRHEPIDMIGLLKSLKSSRALEDAGGLQYPATLPDSIASPVNLPNYLATVWELWQRRKVIQACGEVAQRAQTFDGPFEDFQWATRSDLASLINDREETRQVWTVEQLNNFNADEDVNAVIGMKDGRASRYLCRGYGCWLIGPSGVGKSSLIHQMAFSWGLGRPICSITPAGGRPLRIIIVQGENDEGDAAEMTQGVLRSLSVDGFSAELEQLTENVKCITERCAVGERFCDMLEKAIVEHRADIAMVDPFLSFAGIDVSRQDQCSNFLRQQLNPVLVRTGAILFASHHTGKPKFEKGGKSMTAIDYAYSGIGSSELVNWARAVMVLLQLGDGQHYELKLAKRGARAGARHPAVGGLGEFTNSIFLRHATDRIYWEQVGPPEEPEEQGERKGGKPNVIQEIAASNLYSFLSKCPKEGESMTEAAKRLENWVSKEVKKDVSLRSCQRIIPLLVENQKLIKTDGRYYVGPNA